MRCYGNAFINFELTNMLSEALTRELAFVNIRCRGNLFTEPLSSNLTSTLAPLFRLSGVMSQYINCHYANDENTFTIMNQRNCLFYYN
jgi:hypothetical protein